MRIEHSARIGFLPDVDFVADVDLEQIGGQRIVSVNDIIIDGHSMFRSEDERMVELASWLSEEVEKSERIRNILLEDAREDA